jgi:hypothetical protein
LYRGDQEPLATVLPAAVHRRPIEQDAVGSRGISASQTPDADESDTEED